MKKIGKIKEIIVHCTADFGDSSKGIKEIKEGHVVDKGYHDIGYHFLIDVKGELHEGRSLKYRGAHCFGRNKNSIGIAYVGGIGKNKKPLNTLNTKQEMTLRAFLNKYATSGIRVRGHNEFSNKACPSFNVAKWYYTEPTTNIISSKRLKGVGVVGLGMIPVATQTINEAKELASAVNSINIMGYANLIGLGIVILGLGWIIYTKFLDSKRG